jgi:hypothetical protein
MKIQVGTCFSRHLKEEGLMFKLKVSSCFKFSLTIEHANAGGVKEG